MWFSRYASRQRGKQTYWAKGKGQTCRWTDRRTDSSIIGGEHNKTQMVLGYDDNITVSNG